MRYRSRGRLTFRNGLHTPICPFHQLGLNVIEHFGNYSCRSAAISISFVLSIKKICISPESGNNSSIKPIPTKALRGTRSNLCKNCLNLGRHFKHLPQSKNRIQKRNGEYHLHHRLERKQEISSSSDVIDIGRHEIIDLSNKIAGCLRSARVDSNRPPLAREIERLRNHPPTSSEYEAHARI